MSTHPCRTDELFIPDYEIVRQIARGTNGEVVAARHEQVQEFSAVKVLAERATETEIAAITLLKRNLNTNSYDHLLEIKHVGREQGNRKRTYYTMPLADDLKTGRVIFTLPGEYRPRTLGNYLAEQGGRLSLAETAKIGDQILLGLRRLHDVALAHCDVKPSNIFHVDEKWRLGDFGTVIADDARVPQQRRGTFWFMPPDDRPSCKADVYALGKALLFLTFGVRPPRSPADEDHYEAILNGKGEIPSGEDWEDWKQILLRACAPDLAERYSAMELQEALARWLGKWLARFPLELVLSGNLDQLTDEDRRQIAAVEKWIRERVSPLRSEVRRGSVVLHLELTQAQAEYVKAAFHAGELAPLGVNSVRLLSGEVTAGSPGSPVASRASVPPGGGTAQGPRRPRPSPVAALQEWVEKASSLPPPQAQTFQQLPQPEFNTLCSLAFPVVVDWCRDRYRMPFQDAEDLAQEVLLRVCEHHLSLGTSPAWPYFVFWLRRVTLNSCASSFDYWHRLRRYARTQSMSPGQLDRLPNPKAPQPQALLETEEAFRGWSLFLQRLTSQLGFPECAGEPEVLLANLAPLLEPEMLKFGGDVGAWADVLARLCLQGSHRKTVVLMTLQGWPCVEIARTCGVQEKTVQQILRRIRLKLRWVFLRGHPGSQNPGKWEG